MPSLLCCATAPSSNARIFGRPKKWLWMVRSIFRDPTPPRLQVALRPPPAGPNRWAAMLHGLLGLCARSGSLLFSKSWTPSFGLDGAGVNGRGNSAPIDAINLSSLVFALQINAAAAVEDGPVDSSNDTAASLLAVDSQGPVLRSVDMGAGVRIVFHSPPKLPGLLLALFAQASEPMSAAVEQRLLDDISAALGSKFGAQLASRASNQVRTRARARARARSQHATPPDAAPRADQEAARHLGGAARRPRRARRVAPRTPRRRGAAGAPGVPPPPLSY